MAEEHPNCNYLAVDIDGVTFCNKCGWSSGRTPESWAAWVIATCRHFGTTLATAHKVAGEFVGGLWPNV